MANMILVSPVGMVSPTGKQQQVLIGVSEVVSINPTWPTTPANSPTPGTPTGSQINFADGTKLAVLEMISALQAAAG